MSKVPTGWEAVTLNDVLERIVGGGTPSRNIPEYFKGNIPWFTVKDLKTLKPSTAEERITEKAIANSSTNLLPAGTLIIATRIALGKAIRPKVECAINQDLKGIFPIKGVNPDFLLYWFYANDKIIQEHGSGTTVQGIRLETLCSLPIILPPGHEQTRIIEKLEELLSQLDAGTAELKTAQRKLELYRQSLLKAAVEGSLTADWRKKNKPAESGEQLLERILTERRQRWEAQQLARFEALGKKPPKDWQKKYPEPVKPDTADLPELPEGWVWASVSQITLEQRYGSSSKTSDDTSGIPVLRMGNIQKGSLDLESLKFLPKSHHEFPDLLLQDGDILFNRTNSYELVGKSAVFKGQISPCSYASYLISIRIFPSVAPELVSAFINSSYGRAWVKSVVTQQVGQANVNGSKLSALAIPLASSKEQTEIQSRLESGLREISDLSDFIKRLLTSISQQRQNIFRAAFAGELVPQDPNDEPASELLARIQAERDAQAPRKSGRAGRKTGTSATARKSRARKPKEEP